MYFQVVEFNWKLGLGTITLLFIVYFTGSQNMNTAPPPPHNNMN